MRALAPASMISSAAHKRIMQLTNEEVALLRELDELGGEIRASGNIEDKKWERLVAAGYVKRWSASLGPVIYTITYIGRDQLFDVL